VYKNKKGPLVSTAAVRQFHCFTSGILGKERWRMGCNHSFYCTSL